MKMEFSLLPDDVLLFILEHLNTADRIAFAYTCTRLQQLSQQQRSVFRKVDLSFGYKETLQGAMKEFLQDKLMTQHIRELNLNNCTDIMTNANLEEFVIASCPQLQALHVIDCGMSIRSIHSILQNAHKLTTLSFSMVDLSPDDIEFLVQCVESNNGIQLENIKSLSLFTTVSKLHILILRYLLLCCCKCIEKIVITFAKGEDMPYDEWNGMHFPCKPSPSAMNTLHNLHTLIVLSAYGDDDFEEGISEKLQFLCNMVLVFGIIISLDRKKPPGTKWTKFLLSLPLDNFA